MKNKNLLSLAFKGILLGVCLFGLWSSHWYSFNYFTILSNTVVFIYFAISFIWGITQIKKNTDNPSWRPRMQGVVTFSITITFLIYAFLLAPGDIKNNPEAFWTMLNMAVHFIVPIMAILDWIIFCNRGKLKWTDPLLWLFVPLLYFIYIIIRAPIAGNIGPTASPYPYGFIDIQAYGWGAVMGNVGFIIIGMAILAYLFYAVDRLLLRKAE